MATIAACLAPRLLRLFGDRVLLVDGLYPEHALLLARGYRPYLDFTQVAFPLLEQVLALLVTAFGHHVRVIEIFTAAVVAGGAAALYGAGRALGGRLAGAVAAVLWSCAPLLVYFNTFEREIPAALGTSLALLVYLRSPELTWRRSAALAGALLLAFAVKITALMPALALLLHLLLRGRRRDALRVALLYAGGVALLTLACWWRYGQPFLEQVWLFQLFRGSTHAPGAALLDVLALTDPLAAAGWVGLLLVGLPRLRQPVGAPALVLLADTLFLGVLSPTFWNHNLINLLPSLALLAGACAADVLAAGRARRLLAAGLLVALSLAVPVLRAARGLDALFPGATRSGAADDAQTSWGTSREWLARQADFLARHSGPDDVVECALPWTAFEAGRVKFVRDWDVQSIAQGLHASLQSDGLLATLAKRDGVLPLGPGEPPVLGSHPPREWYTVSRLGNAEPYVARLLANDLLYVRPAYLAALAQRRIAFVIEPLPDGVIEEQDLLDAGYERVREGDLAGWRPPSAAASGAAGGSPATPARLDPLFDR